MNNLTLYPFGPLANVRLPKTQNVIAALGEVGILGSVDVDAPRLPLVQFGELGRVAVPVVTVKLNDKVVRRNESIDAELVRNHKLAFKRDSSALKNAIPFLFQAVWLKSLLAQVHLTEQLRSLRVGVAALKGTIDRIALIEYRGRDVKRLSAYLADKFYFIAALPLCLVFNATEKKPGSLQTRKREVELFSAQLTRDSFSSTPGRWDASRVSALIGAVFIWTEKGFTALWTIVIFAPHEGRL